MTRSFAVLTLLALPMTASAQTAAIGPPTIGGLEIVGPPIGTGPSLLYPVRSPGAGGALNGPPLLVPSGPWGGVNYPPPVYPVQIPLVPAPTPQPTAVVLSGEGTAALAVQLPAAGQVWLDGVKVTGASTAEWNLTSPVLRDGQAHTFELKSSWTAGGKTYEARRSVPVAVGDRSRLIVVSGTETKE
ncbi:hypothetical protein R5W23_005486 [Gemmata sp. JC673]|uniref:TIGR03000 domain-containing protein n=1 Tax=Gemmata algarum TaxID=2975278 RepID=A0ABU5EST0_9BACT|nr:hypothetical protein [Gemmata algarum]MDY3558393.1 hypothetical protein [Gemmata algarum]